MAFGAIGIAGEFTLATPIGGTPEAAIGKPKFRGPINYFSKMDAATCFVGLFRVY
jgi:hypothetical protein